MDVEKFLREQSRPGQSISEGRFTLDAAKAAEKLEKFQLDDPRRYLLKLVQAAVASDCSAIRVKRERFHLRFEFNIPLDSPMADPESLLASVSGEELKQEPAVHHLMIAFAAARRTKHTSLEFQVTTPEQSIRIRLSPEQEIEFDRGKSYLETAECVFLRREPVGFWSLLKGSEDRAFDHECLSTFCQFSPVRLTLDGADIRTKWSPRKKTQGTWLGQYDGIAMNLVEQFQDSGDHHISRRIDRRLFGSRQGELVWESALETFRLKLLSQGADTFFIRGLSASVPVAYEMVPTNLSAAYGCALNLSLHETARIHFVLFGVNIATKEMAFGLPGLSAIGWWDFLKTDVTGLNLVEDRSLEKLHVQLRNEYKLLLSAVLENWQLIRPVFIKSDENLWPKSELKRILRRVQRKLLRASSVQPPDYLDPVQLCRLYDDRQALVTTAKARWFVSKTSFLSNLIRAVLSEGSREVTIALDQSGCRIWFAPTENSLLAKPGLLLESWLNRESPSPTAIHFSRAYYDCLRRGAKRLCLTAPVREGVCRLQLLPGFEAGLVDENDDLDRCELAIDGPKTRLPSAFRSELAELAAHHKAAITVRTEEGEETL